MSIFSFTNRRRTSSQCVCSGCVWLLVLVIVQQCGGYESDEQNMNYTTPNLDLNYNSSTEVNAKAMEQLYYVTNFFIDIIQKEDSYPEGLFEDKDGRFTTAKLSSDWKLLVQHYAGVVSVAVVGIVFAVLMPLIALFFCCCRCAGRCGGRAQPFEKRRDPCRRVTLGIILSAIAIIVLFGVVCAFVTNEYMEDGIKNLPSKLNVAISDTNLYMNNTAIELNHLLVDNFRYLTSVLEDDLTLAASTLTEQLKNGTPLAVLDTLMHFGDGLKSIKEDVDKISNLTEKLKNEANDVNTKLGDIQQHLEDQLQKCLKAKACKEMLGQVQDMSNPANFTQLLSRYLPKLPNITEQISGLNSIDGIEANIVEGKKNFEDIQDKINKSIDSYKPEVIDALKNAGDGISKQSQDLNNVVKNVTSLVDEKSKPVIKDLDGYIKEYSQYRYYADMAVSSVMLLILLCMTLGLFYGFCGKRPDSGYDDDCCNKATGASFLMLGVYVMFIFSAVLMIITLAHFLLGVAAEKAFCQSLRQPDNSQVLAMLEREKLLSFTYSINGSSVTLNITTVISSCHANDSIYNVLQLENVFNISEVMDYPEKFDISNKIQDLKKQVDTISVNFTLLDNQTMDKLHELGRSSLDLTPLNDVLSSMGNSDNLINLAKKLNETAEKDVDDPTVKDALKSDSEKLRKLYEETIPSMMQDAQDLNRTAHDLDENMKFGYSSLSEAIDKITNEINSAQDFLAHNSTQAMSAIVESFSNSTLEKVYGFLRYVVHGTTTQVGYCEPLSRVYNASLVATCNDILDPFNGFWASIGWCLVLFIPAIILSVKLASLYRKSESYHAAIPDTEYLYDAYADRDNIPLANGPDKKNHHRRYNETYDNSSGYMGDYSSHMGRGDRERRDRSGSAYHPEDARFNDMAPKHWDYSNGAVPRYHSPPLSTEYERPPPYYYPGPGDSGRR